MRRGFTLIELMIVVVIIAVVAAIALPNLVSARLASNETAAIATLRAIISAQSQFRGRALADSDNDGLGEFARWRRCPARCRPAAPPPPSTPPTTDRAA